MQRIFGEFAYGSGPRAGCWWDETCDIADRAAVPGPMSVDVAIVGAGFTGLSAAYELARHGASVAVLDANRIGWGASGRNGGFCCLGGGKIDDDALDRYYGKEARLGFRAGEKAAVAHVEAFLARTGADVDRHSEGETQLAHRAADMRGMPAQAARIRENYGVEAEIVEQGDLAARGLSGGPFNGAMNLPVGFGLNPRKYLSALAEQAETAGARIFERSPVTGIARQDREWCLETPAGTVRAGQVVIATNGYSSEDLPGWLAGRYMPAQSTVLVTRPITPEEQARQGWTSAQMSYDSRRMLHYFRLMPDGRFLFGMRGAVMTGAGADARSRAAVRRDFEKMFPHWASVESRHSWSGFVSLARNRLPFVGEVPGSPGLWASLCYHGNGVAMGSYSGRLVGEMVRTGSAPDCPSVMRRPLERFPLGRWRRALMPAVYAAFTLRDL